MRWMLMGALVFRAKSYLQLLCIQIRDGRPARHSCPKGQKWCAVVECNLQDMTPVRRPEPLIVCRNTALLQTTVTLS